MEKVEEDKFEKKIQEALKSNETMEQSMYEAISAWQFLGISEQEYMQSLVPVVIKQEEEGKVDGGDTSKSEDIPVVLQDETA